MFAVAALVAGAIVLMPLLANHPYATVGALLTVSAALGATHPGRRTAALLTYFAVIYAASLLGVFKGSLGRVSGVWTTPRQTE
jgi:hypothetical protein